MQVLSIFHAPNGGGVCDGPSLGSSGREGSGGEPEGRRARSAVLSDALDGVPASMVPITARFWEELNPEGAAAVRRWTRDSRVKRKTFVVRAGASAAGRVVS